ncbi:MAG: Glu-tRNA(Gln) amidotransferase subunit GatE [Candidatus Bathyarchaeia archaeon]
MTVDYAKVGLKVGLEVHQQLNTATKLFCRCKPELSKKEAEITFIRRLRPTQSELGQIDPAAYFEFQKGVKILYEADRETSCLVEMDEEPPHSLSMEAVEIALTAALMMNATPVDEIHVMRKTVIDGSNTTGFQRTCVIALNGFIKVGEKIIPIQHVSLEEDAARKTGQSGSIIHYRIDRLGIPLLEVATAPVISTPEEAGQVALAIGKILRATGRVKRGIGTIRQDLNISIDGGALVEIKGVQELELIPTVIEYEVQRQLNLIRISEELRNRGIREGEIKEEFIDVTDIFSQTSCKVIRKALEGGMRVFAVKLPRFAGLLKWELMPGTRLGTEIADRAKFWGRVGGIFHTDEMPAYGITLEEIETLRKRVKAGEMDAVVFIADKPENAVDALRAVIERAKEAIKGVPEETRVAKPDGTTSYMRPRPGAARMYPETDIPPIRLPEEYINQLKANLPEMPEEKLKRFISEHHLNEKLAKQLLDSEYSGIFESIIKETKVSSTFVAAFLTETMKSLKREGIPVEKIADDQLLELFRLVDKGEVAKEALPEIVTWLAKNEGKNVYEALGSLGLRMLSREEVEKIIEDIIIKNRKVIDEGKDKAFGFLMGVIMKELRGKADAKLVSNILKSKLNLK